MVADVMEHAMCPGGWILPSDRVAAEAILPRRLQMTSDLAYGMSANRLELNLLRRLFGLPTVLCPSSAGCCMPLNHLWCDDISGLDPQHIYLYILSASPVQIWLIWACCLWTFSWSGQHRNNLLQKALVMLSYLRWRSHLKVCHFFWQRDKSPLCSQMFNAYYLHPGEPTEK